MDRSPTDMLLDAVGVIIGSEGHDYGVRQIAVLIHSHKAEGRATVRGLAEAVGVSKPAVTRAIDRLQYDGLIARVEDKLDRRSVFAKVTPKGAKMLASIGAAMTGASAPKKGRGTSAPVFGDVTPSKKLAAAVAKKAA